MKRLSINIQSGQRLASIQLPELAESEWKEEVFNKLSPQLQEKFAREVDDDTISYSAFIGDIGIVANRYKQSGLVQTGGRSG